MNWLPFTCWVGGIYLLYYLVLVLTDLARGRSPTTAAGQELSFAPELVDAAAHAPAGKPQPAMMASGGVSLKETFDLARKDMLVYTRAVSFG
jgi:hypothetical protein